MFDADRPVSRCVGALAGRPLTVAVDAASTATIDRS
jgi:hypothetical protein